ncbi:MAG: ABC transporter substrate-binding protein [Spirochaetaceae bacterium]|jgi:putative ABC transport system substrate-binding protein|nr:ABC transporter substrate-binding protein [Spirochaetaceae bacterium]
MTKKRFSIAAAIAVIAAAGMLSACQKKQEAAPAASKEVLVGVSKIVAHEALDAVERGVVDRVTESGKAVRFDLQNAAGDMNAAAQIAAQFKSEDAAVTVGIATPAALALANNITAIPVVFSAVTDPVGAKLVDNLQAGKGNVTGVSDAIDEPRHIKMFKDIAKIKTLGYIYTSSEDNSVSSLARVKEACAAEGLALVEQAITNSSELRQAAETIIGRVDGIYITTDNTVFAALPALTEVCNKNKKPLFSADFTACKNGGAFIAFGFDYYKIGLATGDIVVQLLDGKKPADIPTKFLTEKTDIDFLIDLDQAANCGITVPEDYLAQANYLFQNGKLTQK